MFPKFFVDEIYFFTAANQLIDFQLLESFKKLKTIGNIFQTLFFNSP